jgi:ABC-type proline/glycine betaine transport system permease subunit
VTSPAELAAPAAPLAAANYVRRQRKWGLIRQVDPKLFETAQVLGFSFSQRFRRIIAPGAAPQVLVGARQSLAIAR